MQLGWISRVGGIGMAFALVTLGGGAGAQDIMGHPEDGATIFKKCLACHRVGPNAKNGVGPVLNGVVGRAAGAYPGYNYSNDLKNSGLTWDEATLMTWVKGPKALVPGTKMTFLGLPTDQNAADVVSYLAQYDADGNMVAPPAQ